MRPVADPAGPTLDGLPWPEGDADGVAQSGRDLHAAATGLRGVAARLQGAAGGAAGWQGRASTAFHGAVEAERAPMTHGASALEGAAGRLSHLATAIEHAQTRVRRLADEVRRAEDAADRAEARAATLTLAAGAAALLVDAAGELAPHALQQDAADAADAASGAASSATTARAHADEVRTRATREAQQACDEVSEADANAASAVDDAAAAAPLGGSSPPSAATPAQTFGATTFRGLSQSDWQRLAYAMAGIDHWDPDAGLLANDGNVRRVYALYGDLWTHDHNLQWAGMANLVGPLFYAGWQDLYTARTTADPGERADLFKRALGIPDWVPDSPFGPVGDLAGSELTWYEHKFLSMQKQIFDDMAYKHLAYSVGGIGLIRDLADRSQIDLQSARAFENIAAGDPVSVQRGNASLLEREQHFVIQNDYDAMRNHDGPVGDVFTSALTWTAGNPIPGGHAYRDDYHHDLQVPVPTPVPIPFFHPKVPVPFVQVPDGNVSVYDDRWRWIRDDMLPAYQRYLEHPNLVQATIDTPVATRADQYRLLPLPYPGG